MPTGFLVGTIHYFCNIRSLWKVHCLANKPIIDLWTSCYVYSKQFILVVNNSLFFKQCYLAYWQTLHTLLRQVYKKCSCSKELIVHTWVIELIDYIAYLWHHNHTYTWRHNHTYMWRHNHTCLWLRNHTCIRYHNSIYNWRHNHAYDVIRIHPLLHFPVRLPTIHLSRY